MEITSQVKSLTLKSVFVVIIFCVLLWFSIFTYALLYYLYIPAIAHVKPIYFRYDTLCSKGENCFFPYDNVTLIEKERYEILSSGQAYAMEVILVMPESEKNFKQGIFMIHLDMLSHHGEVLKTSRRPAMLHYRSRLYQVIHTLFYVPVLLMGSTEEKQTITVPLFEKYVEDALRPSYYAFVELESDSAQVYSSHLNIHAQFTGLRYLMYYWPLLSAAAGIGLNFATVSSVVLLVWLRQVMHDSSTPPLRRRISEEELLREIRQAVHRRRSPKRNEDTTDPEVEELSHRSREGRPEGDESSLKKESSNDEFEDISPSPSTSPLLRRRVGVVV